MKIHERIFFLNKDVCVFCSLKNRQRYYIIKVDKSKGAAFELTVNFLKKDLSIEENLGTYACISCYKMLQRINDIDSRRTQLHDKLMSSCQKFRVISVKKRNIHGNQTPTMSKFLDQKSTPVSSLTSASHGLDLPSGSKGSLKKISKPPTPSTSKLLTRSLFPCPSTKDTDSLAVPLSPLRCKKRELKTVQISKLKHTVSFRSAQLVKQLLPVTTALANGSIRKALTLLLNSSNATVKEKVKREIQNVINKECSTLSKCDLELQLQKTDTSDLESFDLKKIQEDFEIHAPFLWSFASQAATSKYTKTYDCVKVTSALCVLLQGRSRVLNSLQHSFAIAMYNNQLQKDGFSVLARLGFSVSHATMNAKLNIAKAQNENLMKTYQSSLKDFIASNRSSCVEVIEAEHTYATVGVEKKLMGRMKEHSYAVYNAEPERNNAPLGYRFNLDNLDFHIRVREMTQEHQNISRHFTQIMALVDRVNCEHLSDEPVGDLLNVQNSEFLPTVEDNYTLRKDMIQVVSNILVENLPSFQVFKNIYPTHFLHIYSTEMAKKSTVVYFHIRVFVESSVT